MCASGSTTANHMADHSLRNMGIAIKNIAEWIEERLCAEGDIFHN